MIFSIGTEMIDTERMGQLVAKGRPQLEALFSAREIEYCESKTRKAQHYAVRYAAKGAALKALNAGGREGLALSDIEVIDDERGKPEVFVSGKVKDLFEHHRIKLASLSLSHTKESAIAVIILQN